MTKLTQKQYKSYDRLSRYQQFPIYYHTEDNKYTYGTTANLIDTTPYTLYEVKPNDTLDKIALKSYGTPEKYWIIADFNRIQDPYKELKVGEYLKVPDVTFLRWDM